MASIKWEGPVGQRRQLLAFFGDTSRGRGGKSAVHNPQATKSRNGMPQMNAMPPLRTMVCPVM
jgi:hypothetical protein